MPVVKFLRSILVDLHEDGTFAGATAIYARVLKDDDGRIIEALKEENGPLDAKQMESVLGASASAHIVRNAELEEQIDRERKSAKEAYDALEAQGARALEAQAKEHEKALEEVAELGLKAVADVEGQQEAKLKAKDNEIAAIALERDLAKENAKGLESQLAALAAAEREPA